MGHRYYLYCWRIHSADVEFIMADNFILPDPGPVRSLAFEVTAEVMWCMKNWPKFNSAHEGFAVLLEEVDELKQEVWLKQKNRDVQDMRKECIQVAAMAMRMILDVCNEEDIRK